MLGDVSGIVGEGFGGVAGLPAAFVLEGLGEVPVKEGAIGLDACAEERVEHAVVEVEALGVGGAGALREDSGPRYGKAVGLEAEVLHELDVFFVAMEVVVGYVAGVVVFDLAGSVGEGIPDGGATAFFVDGTFDLVGGGGGAPEESLWEVASGGCCGLRLGWQRRESGEYGGCECG